MTLTEEQKNSILRNVVSVKEIEETEYSSTLKRTYKIKLTSGSELVVTTSFDFDFMYWILPTIELRCGGENYTITDCEDLASALIYNLQMDEKEAFLEEQRKEKIKFESIVNDIGKEPTVTFDKINYKTPAKVPELVNDVRLTFWQKVWDNIKNYDKGIGERL